MQASACARKPDARPASLEGLSHVSLTEHQNSPSQCSPPSLRRGAARHCLASRLSPAHALSLNGLLLFADDPHAPVCACPRRARGLCTRRGSTTRRCRCRPRPSNPIFPCRPPWSATGVIILMWTAGAAAVAAAGGPPAAGRPGRAQPGLRRGPGLCQRHAGAGPPWLGVQCSWERLLAECEI